MARYLLLALNGPNAGVEEADYNQWYDNQVRKIAAIPGVQSGRRFKVVGLKGVEQPYLAAYEIDSDNVGEFLRDMDARLRPLEPPFDQATSVSILAVEMD